MAQNDDLDLSGEGGFQAKPRKGSKMWLWVSLVVLLLAGGGVGAFFLLQGDGGGAGPVAETQRPLVYKTLEPELLGNIAGGGRVRFVQIGVVLAARDARKLESVDQHMPVIRNNLLMLLSDKTYDDLISTEGKEATRAEMLESIREVLTERAGDPVVESIYFNSFVMQ